MAALRPAGERTEVTFHHQLPKSGGELSVHLHGAHSRTQFDGQPGQPSRAPEHGEHTEEVLLELGLSWDEVTALKENHAIG